MKTVAHQRKDPDILPPSTELSALVNTYTALATKKLLDHLPNEALAAINQAHILCSNSTNSQDEKSLVDCTTLNTEACVLKAIGRPHMAIAALKRALNSLGEIKSEDIAVNAARCRTLINLSGVLSSVNQHEASLKHAAMAVRILTRNKSASDDTGLLIAAYFNLGTEYEHLRRLPEAAESYRRCSSLADEEHPLWSLVQKALTEIGNK